MELKKYVIRTIGKSSNNNFKKASSSRGANSSFMLMKIRPSEIYEFLSLNNNPVKQARSSDQNKSVNLISQRDRNFTKRQYANKFVSINFPQSDTIQEMNEFQECMPQSQDLRISNLYKFDDFHELKEKNTRNINEYIQTNNLNRKLVNKERQLKEKLLQSKKDDIDLKLKCRILEDKIIKLEKENHCLKEINKKLSSLLSKEKYKELQDNASPKIGSQILTKEIIKNLKFSLQKNMLEKNFYKKNKNIEQKQNDNNNSKKSNLINISGNINERNLFKKRNSDHMKNCSHNDTITSNLDQQMQSNSVKKESFLNHSLDWIPLIQIIKKILSCNNLPELCLTFFK